MIYKPGTSTNQPQGRAIRLNPSKTSPQCVLILFIILITHGFSQDMAGHRGIVIYHPFPGGKLTALEFYNVDVRSAAIVDFQIEDYRILKIDHESIRAIIFYSAYIRTQVFAAQSLNQNKFLNTIEISIGTKSYFDSSGSTGIELEQETKAWEELAKKYSLKETVANTIAESYVTSVKKFKSGQRQLHGKWMAKNNYDLLTPEQAAESKPKGINIFDVYGHKYANAFVIKKSPGKIKITHDGGILELPLTNISKISLKELGLDQSEQKEKATPISLAEAIALEKQLLGKTEDSTSRKVEASYPNNLENASTIENEATDPRKVERAQKIKKDAEQGNAFAQTTLGYVYYLGLGAEIDLAEAVKWFRKAAEQGEADAQYMLGYCYCTSRGVTQDFVEAVKWFLKAAGQGDANAQSMLGVCYARGDGVPKDFNAAVKWFHKAAEQGVAVAQYQLGNCYANGDGVPKDYTEAAKWYRNAADQNYAVAQNSLGMAYLNGEGVMKDKIEAQAWFFVAGCNGESMAINNGLLLEKLVGNEVSQLGVQRGKEIQRKIETTKNIKKYVSRAESNSATATSSPPSSSDPDLILLKREGLTDSQAEAAKIVVGKRGLSVKNVIDELKAAESYRMLGGKSSYSVLKDSDALNNFCGVLGASEGVFGR